MLRALPIRARAENFSALARHVSVCVFLPLHSHVRHRRRLVVMAAVVSATGQHAVVLQLEVDAGCEFAGLLVGAIHGLVSYDVAYLDQVAVDRNDGGMATLFPRHQS